jgi:hypothetical protein
VSDPRSPEPTPVSEPPVDPLDDADEMEEDGDDEDEEDLAQRAAARAHCGRLYGHLPCIRIIAADGVSVLRTEDCTGWCPVLRRKV